MNDPFYRTYLFERAAMYLKERPKKLTKEQETNLFNALYKVTFEMEKVDSPELREFLESYVFAENKDNTINPNQT